jgi:hypothetical protein
LAIDFAVILSRVLFNFSFVAGESWSNGRIVSAAHTQHYYVYTVNMCGKRFHGGRISSEKKRKKNETTKHGRRWRILQKIQKNVWYNNMLCIWYALIPLNGSMGTTSVCVCILCKYLCSVRAYRGLERLKY